ncbi:MAG: heparinase II/III family protein [Lentisphaeria bacterium]|nr:heparinase II/III family protein [Lentisphaeria bacterium]
MAKLSLIPSPRLYVSADTAANLKDKLHSPFLKNMADQVLKDADRLVRAAPLKEGSESTYQAVTRPIDTHLQCLTCAWTLTRAPRYRQAAIKHLSNLTTFNQISCEARVNTPPDKELPFCLSYGELSATVGLMYDLFRQEMTDDEQAVFFAVLDKFLMRAAVKCLDSPPWWANKEWSNWNGVCAGGMGIMALAFHDDHPDAPKLIPFVEKSLGEYFKSYIANGGGCLEGTGYWNYGMNYSMRYLLSWENATQKKHPAFKMKELGQSLFFPLDFTGVSFGDNDGWGPTAFYFLLADRLNQRHAALNAATYLAAPEKLARQKKQRKKGKGVNGGTLLYAADAIPTAEEIDRLNIEHTAKKAPVARIYTGMDWAALADDEAFPSLRLALRGGSSKISGHGMIDLLSFRCRVNDELMITDQQDGGYMATTFTRRGHELYGRSPASKSTLFVDGLGCDTDVACDTTEIVRGQDLLGIRVDASGIYLPRWKDKFIGRLALMVENSYWLIVDHMLGTDEADIHWLESRFHTLAESQSGKSWVSLKSGNQRLMMTFAALGKGVLLESTGMPAQPTVPRTTIFRWMGAEASHDNLHVTALNPGAKKLALKLERKQDGAYTITVTRPGGAARTIRLTHELKLA